MKKVSNLRIVYFNTPSRENADFIAGEIIDKNLAACCSVVPHVTSTFKWKDKTEKREEFLLIIKTIDKKIDELETALIRLSQDDVPEIITLSAHSVFDKYYNWIINELI
jgi:periplasmic divalent cation tolerance protein